MSDDSQHMRQFWDERAREDAFHFVDNRLPYRSADEERFWINGASDLDAFLGIAGVDLKSDDEVLEIGCGVGRLTRALASRVGSVIALDVSGEMLSRAQHYNHELTNVIWLQGDGASLDGVEDASVDVCISHVVFQHIPDPRITLSYVSEMGRALRPGGRAAFQISNDARIHRAKAHGGAWERVKQRGRAVLGRAPRGQADRAWLGSAVDLDDLRETVSLAGMTIENITGAGTQFCIVHARREPA